MLSNTLPTRPGFCKSWTRFSDRGDACSPVWAYVVSPFGGTFVLGFSVPYLVFSEKALISWRSTFKTDGATRFSEVAGGLNQMTIAKFEGFVARSPFKISSIELVPIRKVRPLHNRLTREFTTAIVRCCLVKRQSGN